MRLERESWIMELAGADSLLSLASVPSCEMVPELVLVLNPDSSLHSHSLWGLRKPVILRPAVLSPGVLLGREGESGGLAVAGPPRAPPQWGGAAVTAFFL